MMLLLAVILIALAVLFALTALALESSNQLGHPGRVAVLLAALLVLGLALLLE